MATSKKGAGRPGGDMGRGGRGAGHDHAISEGLVRDLSQARGEPQWMTTRRVEALTHLAGKTLPEWAGVGPSLLDESRPPSRPAGRRAGGGEGPPPRRAAGESPGTGAIRETTDAIQAARRERLAAQGVVVCDLANAIRDHADLVQRYFGTVVAAADSAVAALNTAAWSGGSFVYVPPGVTVDIPVQVDFRLGQGRAPGRIERTVIVAGEGASVECVRGCSAPAHSAATRHVAVVEIVCEAASQVTFSTIQNWSGNVVNLVAERARCDAEARMVWIGADVGSGRTRRRPSLHLAGPKASGEMRAVAFAGPGQHHATTLEVVHAAPETTSAIVSKAVASGGGRTSSRGVARAPLGAHGAIGSVRCDALLLDDGSRCDTDPVADLVEPDARVGCHGGVSRVGDRQRYYLTSRGLSEQQAAGMLVNAFVEPVTGALPLEYAVEWSRLIELQLDSAVG